ncbi:Protein kinase superfamily protein [Gracilaria domingensis]|nr:Protein kinase superfamily protein [Gracilaria domingensis]
MAAVAAAAATQALSGAGVRSWVEEVEDTVAERGKEEIVEASHADVAPRHQSLGRTAGIAADRSRDVGRVEGEGLGGEDGVGENGGAVLVGGDALKLLEKATLIFAVAAHGETVHVVVGVAGEHGRAWGATRRVARGGGETEGWWARGGVGVCGKVGVVGRGGDGRARRAMGGEGGNSERHGGMEVHCTLNAFS